MYLHEMLDGSNLVLPELKQEPRVNKVISIQYFVVFVAVVAVIQVTDFYKFSPEV